MISSDAVEAVSFRQSMGLEKLSLLESITVVAVRVELTKANAAEFGWPVFGDYFWVPPMKTWISLSPKERTALLNHPADGWQVKALPVTIPDLLLLSQERDAAEEAKAKALKEQQDEANRAAAERHEEFVRDVLATKGRLANGGRFEHLWDERHRDPRIQAAVEAEALKKIEEWREDLRAGRQPSGRCYQHYKSQVLDRGTLDFLEAKRQTEERKAEKARAAIKASEAKVMEEQAAIHGRVKAWLSKHNAAPLGAEEFVDLRFYRVAAETLARLLSEKLKRPASVWFKKPDESLTDVRSVTSDEAMAIQQVARECSELGVAVDKARGDSPPRPMVMVRVKRIGDAYYNWDRVVMVEYDYGPGVDQSYQIAVAVK